MPPRNDRAWEGCPCLLAMTFLEGGLLAPSIPLRDKHQKRMASHCEPKAKQSPYHSTSHCERSEAISVVMPLGGVLKKVLIFERVKVPPSILSPKKIKAKC